MILAGMMPLIPPPSILRIVMRLPLIGGRILFKEWDADAITKNNQRDVLSIELMYVYVCV